MVFRAANALDIDAVVSMMRRYYGEDGYPFEAAEARLAVAALVENDAYGWLWIIEADDTVHGYLAVTLGYSLEYLGRDAFIDELYLVPESRGRGWGTKAIAVAEDACRAAGVMAIHLEVERNKTKARELYRRSGFEDHDRFLMTKLLR